VRTPLALAAGLVLVHDAIFASDSGLASLATALAQSGHGQLWAIVSIVAIMAGAFIVVGAIARLLRAEVTVRRLQLDAEAQGSGLASRTAFDWKTATPPVDYVNELRSLWPRLFVGVLLGFLVQENLEALAGQAHGAGLEPIFAGHPLAIPVTLFLTFAIAAVAALVRHRAAALFVRASVLRLHMRMRQRPGAVMGLRPSSDGGVLAREAIRLLPQEGRAPPRHAAYATA
jgi:hypothetical protein